MIDIYLEEILLKGRFGPIELGADKQKVIDELGNPDEHEAFNEKSYGLKYGWFEFYFENGILDWFQNKHLLNEDYQFEKEFHFENSRFNVTTWFKNYKEDLKLNNFKKWLTKKGERFIEKPFWDSIKLVTSNNIEIQFYNSKTNQIDVKSENELIDHELLTDFDNWKFAAFYVLNK